MSDTDIDCRTAVVGAGAAGLATTIGNGYEGLFTWLLNATAEPGGQAAEALHIRNYPGYCRGIDGLTLTNEMLGQALTYDCVRYIAPVVVRNIIREDSYFVVMLSNGEAISAQSVVLAIGLRPKPFFADCIDMFRGRGVQFGSPSLRADYTGQRVVIVGSGNAAGQAALHLSAFDGSRVTVVTRSHDLAMNMSHYLIEKLRDASNVQLLFNSRVTRVGGDAALRSIQVASDGRQQEFPLDRLFVLTGGVPNTEWLPNSVARDDAGYIYTGLSFPDEQARRFREWHGRSPLSYETTVPGIFAVGSVVAGATNRVISAAGAGGSVTPVVYEYLRGVKSLQLS